MCNRDISVHLWLSCSSPHIYLYVFFLLYHSNGTKSTPKKRKHEEGNEDAVTKKSKIVRTKRGTDVRINTYMYSVVVVFIYKFFTCQQVNVSFIIFAKICRPYICSLHLYWYSKKACPMTKNLVCPQIRLMKTP